MGFQGSNLSWLHTRQVPYLLYYQSSPQWYFKTPYSICTACTIKDDSLKTEILVLTISYPTHLVLSILTPFEGTNVWASFWGYLHLRKQRLYMHSSLRYFPPCYPKPYNCESNFVAITYKHWIQISKGLSPAKRGIKEEGRYQPLFLIKYLSFMEVFISVNKLSNDLHYISPHTLLGWKSCWNHSNWKSWHTKVCV